MKNQEIRAAIKNAGLKYYEVAAHIGVADTTFTKWLRFELPKERKKLVLDAIKELRRAKK